MHMRKKIITHKHADASHSDLCGGKPRIVNPQCMRHRVMVLGVSVRPSVHTLI